jgi:DNA-binding NarL/FixJ family response regulator
VGNAAAWARSFERIEKICQVPAESRALRVRLLEEMGRVVHYDAHAWLLTDPASSVGSSPVAEVPCLPELPRLIRLKYLTEINRWTLMETPVALLGEATDGVPSRSRVWRELLARYDVADVASIVFRDPFGCWGFLDLWRGATLGCFTAGDRDYLTAIAGPVTAALRRAEARTFLAPVAKMGHPRGPVVLLLSSDLAVVGETAETRDYLHVLVPPDGDSSPIPASAYNVAAQLIAVEAGVDANPPSARVHLSGGRWLTLRAAWIGDGQRSHGGQVAVTIEDSSSSERAEVFARAHCFSSRESELFGHLVSGSDTRDLARLMFLSEHTVQDHLKSIFTKASVHSRRTLLSRALGS